MTHLVLGVMNQDTQNMQHCLFCDCFVRLVHKTGNIGYLVLCHVSYVACFVCLGSVSCILCCLFCNIGTLNQVLCNIGYMTQNLCCLFCNIGYMTQNLFCVTHKTGNIGYMCHVSYAMPVLCVLVLCHVSYVACFVCLGSVSCILCCLFCVSWFCVMCLCHVPMSMDCLS